MKRRAIVEGPSELPEPTPLGRKVAIGCGLALLGAALAAGALGLLVQGWRRFAAPAIAERRESAADASTPDDPPPEPGDASGRAPTSDPLADMRRRYAPGPHVRVEGMIPAAQPVGSTGAPQPWRAGRSTDTPWVVYGARFEPGPPPATSPEPTSRAVHAPGEPVERPLTLLPGVPVEARVRASDADGGFLILSYVVAFDGYAGHFVLPATVQTELGVVSAGGSDGATVRFTIGAPIARDGAPARGGPPFSARVRIAAIDDYGRVSPYLTREISILPVGTGDLEVALTMSEPTDLDLYVTDPTGSTVFFGNTTVASGGHLDLDANAACSAHVGVNAEHVYWSPGTAPRGTYLVRVAHWQNCVQGRSVRYRVTVRNCGETVILSGRFEGFGRTERCLTSSADPTYCQDVVRFVVPPCRAAN